MAVRCFTLCIIVYTGRALDSKELCGPDPGYVAGQQFVHACPQSYASGTACLCDVNTLQLSNLFGRCGQFVMHVCHALQILKEHAVPCCCPMLLSLNIGACPLITSRLGAADACLGLPRCFKARLCKCWLLPTHAAIVSLHPLACLLSWLAQCLTMFCLLPHGSSLQQQWHLYLVSIYLISICCIPALHLL